MNVDRAGAKTRLELTPEEVQLLRWALERASFIDTPAKEQAGIAAFCARVLEALTPRRAP